VVLNDRLAVVLRRSARAAEVYSLGAGPAKARAWLAPAGCAAAGGLAPVKVTENTPAGAALDVAFPAPGGATLTLGVRLAIGQVFVETQPRGAVSALWMAAACRFAVLPDFFADDIVLDAAELGVSKAELPADYALLHLCPGREAIVMAVRSEAQTDVGITLSGEGEGRTIDAAEIPYGRKGTVWVAVLAAPAIWHRHDLAANDRQKVVALDWTAPYAATWRCDWRRHDGLSDSWEMLLEQPDGRFAKFTPLGSAGTLPSDRKRWTTVLGSFQYPCWIDRTGRGFLQPLPRVLRFQGPTVIYPIGRAPQTPMDTFTVVDLVRATLGVGPCEYVLDVEGQKSQSRGRATCSARDTLNPIYKAGRQRAQRAKIEQTLQEVIVFIKFIRSRIEQYVAFGQEIRQYLDERGKAQPELARHLRELDLLAREIDARVAARARQIRTPAEAEKLADDFRRTLMDYEGADAYSKCRPFTEAWVAIGSNQDELVGECRWAVKVLRQRAALLAAGEPGLGEVAREIRRRSHQALRNPAGHEGAGH
jgi:hypothetical protein